MDEKDRAGDRRCSRARIRIHQFYIKNGIARRGNLNVFGPFNVMLFTCSAYFGGAEAKMQAAPIAASRILEVGYGAGQSAPSTCEIIGI
jgi:hypothetical protein